MSRASHSERRAAFKIRYTEGDEPIPGYRLIKRLGQGGVGQVFKAVGPGGVAVALKIISGLDEAGGRKELRALQNVKNIGHANLVAIYGFWLKDEDGNIIELNAEEEGVSSGSDGKSMRPAQLFVVMRLCEGSLFDRLTEYRKKGQPGIPEDELIGYCEDAAKAIDYLNMRCNMQHCDIKPQNILIVGGTAQVCDYGLVKDVDDPHRSTNMVSPLYAAPELLPLSAKEPGPSHATDQCSLAMSYIELRTGKLPFPSHVNPDNPFQVMQAVAQGELDFSRLPKAEQKVIARATAHEPGDRYENCVKMVRELRRAVEGGGTDPNIPAKVDTRPVAPVAPFRIEYHEGDEAVPGYKLTKKLGGDGLEAWFLASGRDSSTVAFKIVYDLDEVTARRELQFLQKIRDIRHPYLVPVYGVWLKYEDGTLVDHNLAADKPAPGGSEQRPTRRAQVFIAAQPCEGNLRDRLIQSQHEGQEGLPPDELAGYLEEASRAIDYLNQTHGVSHRDIKPENIMLVGGVALVGNFGLARHPYDPRRGIDDPLPYYAAPELLPKMGYSGERAAVASSDLYSLALSYIELRTGRLPFRSAVPGEILTAITDGRLDLSRLSAPEQNVLASATALDPGERYTSAVQMVRDLRAALAEKARLEAQPKSGIRQKAAAPEITIQLPVRSPFKLQYSVGDEPIPGYKLEKLLGSAGIDAVFQAVDPDGVRIALKICYGLDEPDARAELRFLQRMSSVRHPHLVAIDALWLKGEDGLVVTPSQMGDDPLPEPATSESRPPRGAQLFIAMPLCDGNLRSRLEQTNKGEQRGIPPEELLGYFEEAAKAVDFLNTVLSIQHCNLKPENILILRGVAQLGDISSARSPLDMRSTVELLVPFYAPPELLPVGEGEPEPSSTSDQYSLAMCYVELRTGKLPLGTRNVLEGMLAISNGEVDLSELPEAERAIIEKALSLDPSKRFSSATKMVRDLRRAAEGAVSGYRSGGTTGKVQITSPFQPRYAEGDEPVPGYRLLERLGASGYDEVFRAAGPRARKFAIKIVYGLDEVGARHEFRLLQRMKEIRHSHLIDIDDIWLKDESGNLFDQNTLPDEPTPDRKSSGDKPRAAQILFSMPVSESSLAELVLDFQKAGEKGIPSRDLCDYFDAAAKAIDHLNNVHGTPHGAIEPRHLLILGGAVRLSDFGLSSSRPLGKPITEPVPPYYTAPELLTSGEPRPLGNVRSDLYSLAMSYVHLSTGKLPFRSTDPAVVRQAILNHELDLSNVPQAELSVIGKALSKRPEKRYASATEMMRALRAMVGLPDQATYVEPVGETPQVRYPIKSKYVQGDMPVPGHRLVELIGRGGFGDVWKATSPGGIREVALKIVYDADGQLGQRELVGLWQIKKIKHENMVPIQALWIKDRQGNLVEDEQIALLEREVFADNLAARTAQIPAKAGPTPGAPTQAAHSQVDQDSKTISRVRGKGKAAIETAPTARKKQADGNGKHGAPTVKPRVGTLLFEQEPPPEPDPERSLVDKQLITLVGATMSGESEETVQKRTFEPAQLFVAMELCDGHLLHRLNRCKEQGLTGIPSQELLGYMDLAADVIDEFNLKHHTRHRDIKPQNLLTIGKSLKVCDFGLVRKTVGGAQGQGVAFTPEYAAPEQVRGEDSPTTDQYCLAVTYAHLRTGYLPFQTAGKYDIIAGKKQTEAEYAEFLDLSRLSRGERSVLQRALSIDPEARYGSCKEFTSALREAVFPAPPPQRVRRNSWLLPAIATLLLMMVAVAIAIIIINRPPEEVPEQQLDGTLIAVQDEGSEIVVRDEAGVEHRLQISPEAVVILNEFRKQRSDLRPRQIVKLKYRAGQPTEHVEATSPELPPVDVSRLVSLVEAGKLGEAFEEAGKLDDPAAADSHVELAWLKRAKEHLDRGRAQDLSAILAEAFLARDRFPGSPIYKEQRSKAASALLALAERDLILEQFADADASFATVSVASGGESADSEAQLWHRDALWGRVRAAAGVEPENLETLAAVFGAFDTYQAAHADLAPRDAADQSVLRCLRVILAADQTAGELAPPLQELITQNDWRATVPRGWQRDRIDKLCVGLVDALEEGKLAPELREVAGKLLDFDGFLVRATAKLTLTPPRFDLAKKAIELAREKAAGDPQKDSRVKAALAEVEILDRTSKEDAVVRAFVDAVKQFNGRDETPRKLITALSRRVDDGSFMFTEPLVAALISEFRRLSQEGLAGLEFEKLYGQLAARHLVYQYASNRVYDGDLPVDFARSQKDGVKLTPEVKAVLDSAFVEYKLETARPEELPVLRQTAAESHKTLGSSPFGRYAAFVRAAADFRADLDRATDSAEAIADAWKDPPKSLQVKERKELAARMLVAGAERLLRVLRDSNFAASTIVVGELNAARDYLKLAESLLAKEIDFSTGARSALLLEVDSPKPRWGAVRSAAAALVKDKSALEAIRKEGWLGRFYLASAQAHAEIAVVESKPDYLGVAMDHYFEAWKLLAADGLQAQRAKAICERILRPALLAAATPNSGANASTWAALLAAKGRYLQNDSKLAEIFDKQGSSPYSAAYDAFKEAARLDPGRVEYLVSQAYAWEELPQREKGATGTDFASMVAAARGVSGAERNPGVRGLMGKLALDNSRREPNLDKRRSLLKDALAEYNEAIKLAPKGDADIWRYMLGLSYSSLEFAFFKSTLPNEKITHLKDAANHAESATLLSPRPERMDFAYIAWGNALEDQALYVYIAPGESQELLRKASYADAVEKFTAAKPFSDGGLAGLALGRCLYRRAVLCDWPVEERREQLKKAEDELRAALDSERLNWSKRAETHLWIGECLAARAAHEATPAEKTAMYAAADKEFEKATLEGDRLGVLDWPELQLRFVKFAVQRLAATGAANNAAEADAWRRKVQERVEKVFENPPVEVPLAKRVMAVEFLCNAAANSVGKIDTVVRYLPRFEGDDPRLEEFRTELRMLGCLLTLNLPVGPEWDARKQRCRTDALALVAQAAELDEERIGPERKLELRLRALDLAGNFFYREFLSNRNSTAEDRTQGDRYYAEIIQLAPRDSTQAALARYRSADMIKAHLTRNRDSIPAAVATQLRQDAIAKLTPIESTSLDNTTYDRVNTLRRWFSE